MYKNLASSPRRRGSIFIEGKKWIPAKPAPRFDTGREGRLVICDYHSIKFINRNSYPSPKVAYAQPATSIIEAAMASLGRLPPQITSWNAG